MQVVVVDPQPRHEREPVRPVPRVLEKDPWSPLRPLQLRFRGISPRGQGPDDLVVGIEHAAEARRPRMVRRAEDALGQQVDPGIRFFRRVAVTPEELAVVVPHQGHLRTEAAPRSAWQHVSGFCCGFVAPDLLHGGPGRATVTEQRFSGGPQRLRLRKGRGRSGGQVRPHRAHRVFPLHSPVAQELPFVAYHRMPLQRHIEEPVRVSVVRAVVVEGVGQHGGAPAPSHGMPAHVVPFQPTPLVCIEVHVERICVHRVLHGQVDLARHALVATGNAPCPFRDVNRFNPVARNQHQSLHSCQAPRSGEVVDEQLGVFPVETEHPDLARAGHRIRERSVHRSIRFERLRQVAARGLHQLFAAQLLHVQGIQEGQGRATPPRFYLRSLQLHPGLEHCFDVGLSLPNQPHGAVAHARKPQRIPAFGRSDLEKSEPVSDHGGRPALPYPRHIGPRQRLSSRARRRHEEHLAPDGHLGRHCNRNSRKSQGDAPPHTPHQCSCLPSVQFAFSRYLQHPCKPAYKSSVALTRSVSCPTPATKACNCSSERTCGLYTTRSAFESTSQSASTTPLTSRAASIRSSHMPHSPSTLKVVSKRFCAVAEPATAMATKKTSVFMFSKLRRKMTRSELHSGTPTSSGRDSRIRTCGLFVPNEARYRTALYPGRGRQR